MSPSVDRGSAWRAAQIMGLLAGSACSPCPSLTDVPVRGGSDIARALVTETLGLLADELAVGVCIDHVRLDVSMSGDRQATYDPVTHGVRLGASLHVDELPNTLRHEICHGVDLQNGVVDGAEASFAYPDPPAVRHAQVPNEAFADTCALGRDALRALWGADCIGDPDLRAARWISEHVFYGADPGPPPPGATLRPVASAPLSAVAPGATVWVRQGASHEELIVRVPLVGDPFFQSVVDASTGAPSPGAAIAAPTPDPVPPEPPPGWASVLGGPLAPNSTRSVLVADLWLPAGVARRRHAWTEGGWSPADDACAGEPASFFWFDGVLWSAALSTGSVVSWGAWQ